MKIQELFALGMKRPLPDLLEFSGRGTRLNLGCGNQHLEGFVNLDLPAWDAEKDKIPAPNSSVEEIRAFHFLEHIERPIDMLREFQRVLMPGGFANIIVPYYNSQMMAHDLTHRHAFCEETWRQLLNHPGYYTHTKEGWELEIGLNVIIGIVERNLCLMTQLIRK